MKKRVVIVGAGFGGINCAKALAKVPDIEVVVIDRTNHHLFQPLLYQVAMAGLSPAEIAAPVRSMLSEQRNAGVLLAEVTEVDVQAKKVRLDSWPHEVGYDWLVLALGAKTSYFGHDEWERHAPGLKSIDDAVEIRTRVLLAFERAELAETAEERERLLTFAVVGGGPTGVELAGAIAELANYVLARDFRRIKPSEAKVVLVEAGPSVLANFGAALSERATEQLAELGVQVMTNARVADIDERGIRLADGSLIEANTVLWGAGVRATRLAATIGAEHDRQGRVMVEQDCSLPGHPEVFVIGDMAHFRAPDGQPLPGVSPVAMQQARYVAKHIGREARGVGAARPAFRYFDKGSMATIGRSRAIAQAGRMEMSGFLAWLAWLFIHIWYLVGFRNRLIVLINWTWSYLSFKRGARLITGRRNVVPEQRPFGPDEPGVPTSLRTPAPHSVP